MIELLKENENLWDIFTRKEEYDPPLLDKFQRFPAYLSKNRNILEPKVSEFLIQNGLKVKYPDDREFAVCLTHDIDILRFSKSKMVYEMAKSLKRGKFGKSFRIFLNQLSERLNPLWNFDQIMYLEKKYGAKSSFYFMALEKGDTDYNYRIKDLKKELNQIIDSGWEIGLHGGHEAFHDPDMMKKEKELLENVIGKQIIGYRNHYLRFMVPTTWTFLKEAGFEYDATFGYADCVGFRNGMCHPFKPFDLTTKKCIDILEIPLTIMDSTLFEYMRLDLEEAWELTKWLVHTVEKCHGVLTIIWHNTSMDGFMLEFYEEILKYCQSQRAWMTSGEEICKWWKKNEFLGERQKME